MEPISHQTVDASRVVAQGPGAYYGALLVATSGGAAISWAWAGVRAWARRTENKTPTARIRFFTIAYPQILYLT